MSESVTEGQTRYIYIYLTVKYSKRKFLGNVDDMKSKLTEEIAEEKKTVKCSLLLNNCEEE